MIYLMRHAQSEGNVSREYLTSTDKSGVLTEFGEMQARKAGEWLKDKEISQIISSDLKRAHQTARIVADLIGIEEIETTPDLRELDYGDFEGKRSEDYFPEWKVVYDGFKMGNWTAEFPNGDSFRTAYDRLKRACDMVHAKGNALLVSHNGLLRTVLPFVCDDDIMGSRVFNTGIVTVNVHEAPRYYTVGEWGLYHHLDDGDITE